jgi:4-carboxymuconolactone decarboxylase
MPHVIVKLWPTDIETRENMTDSKQLLQGVLTDDEVRSVSPALEAYTKGALLHGLWNRPELSARDRSIVTVAALIARMQTIEMPLQFALALDNGVKPAELSEVITHLAFYSGWPNAMTAVSVAKDVFRERGVKQDQLPLTKEHLLFLNEEAEGKRATQVGNNFGSVTPGLVQNTTDLLFHDLWLRPALAPRDRSLVTVSALIAAGQVAQIPYHLGRAMDNGLTSAEAGEIVTHIAFIPAGRMRSPLRRLLKMFLKSVQSEEPQMPAWSESEIAVIAAVDDLHVSPFRDDGQTYGTPTWIWSVVAEGKLYVRPYNGSASRWYKAAMRQQAGRITIAGLKKDVTFADASKVSQSAIDAAYREKYSKSPYLAAMIGERSRSATVLIQPR